MKVTDVKKLDQQTWIAFMATHNRKESLIQQKSFPPRSGWKRVGREQDEGIDLQHHGCVLKCFCFPAIDKYFTPMDAEGFKTRITEIKTEAIQHVEELRDIMKRKSSYEILTSGCVKTALSALEESRHILKPMEVSKASPMERVYQFLLYKSETRAKAPTNLNQVEYSGSVCANIEVAELK